MNKPNRYRQERDFLLYVAYSTPERKSRNQSCPIHPNNYAAVYTPAANNPIPFAGPCLIWRHGLNENGYGKIRWEDNTDLAHRVAYIITRGNIPLGARILHLCHRRSCIQPSHLYAGTAKDNQEDKDARLAKCMPRIPTKLHSEKYDHLVKNGMKYYWDEPISNQPALFPPEHKCSYTIPAGNICLCQTCCKAESHQLSDLGAPDFLRIEAQNRNDIRSGLDEFCVGRKAGDAPLDFVPKYTRIDVQQLSTQLEPTLFLNCQARAHPPTGPILNRHYTLACGPVFGANLRHPDDMRALYNVKLTN